MVATKLTAKIIVIGNEILSGATLDTNSNFIATTLIKRGIAVTEIRVIPDIEEVIVKTVLELKETCSFLFTTGGIGPTHDDITSESVAKALGVEYELHEEALAIIKSYYLTKNMEINEARRKMAFMPRGAKLILNNVSAAPGYKIDNIHVLAGVPHIMQDMFSNLLKDLPVLDTVYSVSIELNIPEGNIAFELGDIQAKYPKIEIGSYPFNKDDLWGTKIVFRGMDKPLIDSILQEFKEKIGA